MLMHLNSYQMKSLDGLSKVAEPVGGDSAKSFEQSFASLAYSYLQEKAPALLDHLIGFQIVDRNPDETRAAGVFGFDANGQIIFVPAFFLNKDLKGHEMMYLKEQDLFVPLKENWVNFVLNSGGLDLGDSEDMSVGELRPDNPDLRSLSVSPGLGKLGHFNQVRNPEIAEWAQPFMPIMANLMAGNSWRLSKYAGLDERLANRREVLADPYVLVNCMDWYNSYPSFRRSFDKHAGFSELKRAADDIRARLQQRLDILDGPAVKFASTKKAEPNVKSVSIRIYTEQTFSPLDYDNDIIDAIDEKDKEQLKRDGFLIRDDREPGDKAISYDIDLTRQYSNPTDSGFYDVMFKPFDACSCYVATTVYDDNGTIFGKCLVYDIEGKRVMLADTSEVWVWQNSDNRLTQQETVEKLKKMTSASMSSGDTLAILTCDGEAVAPFTVTKSLGGDQYTVYFKEYIPDAHVVKDPIGQITHNRNENMNTRSVLQVGPGKRGIIRLRDKLVAPEGCVVIKDTRSGSGMSYDDCCFSDGPSGGTPKTKMLATMSDMHGYLRTKLGHLKLIDSYDEILVNDTPMPKQAALFHMVRDIGLDEKQARNMLQEVAVKKACRYYIKKAAPNDMQQSYAGEGEGASVQFATGQSNTGSNPYINVPEQSSEEIATVIESLQASLTDPDVYNPMLNMTPDTELNWPADGADDATAGIRQDDVFDTLFMSNMLQASRKDNLVKQFLPDLIKAEDRLGRLLINMWWHSDEFENWYGKSEIRDMEDGILNVFEGLGDLNLSLQQKEVNPMGEVADVMSPNMDTVAEN